MTNSQTLILVAFIWLLCGVLTLLICWLHTTLFRRRRLNSETDVLRAAPPKTEPPEDLDLKTHGPEDILTMFSLGPVALMFLIIIFINDYARK